jgi:hypothetical protein
MANKLVKSSTVDRLFDELLVSIHDAKDFAVEQAPEIAKQMIAEEIAVNQVQIVSSVAVLTLVLLAVLFCVFGPVVRDWNGSQDAPLIITKFVLSLASIPGTLISIGTLYNSSMALMKLRVAPKVFLLKKLSKLSRG